MNIIVQPTGGLCNRMRSIVAAMDVANRLNSELTILWTQDSTLNAKFYEIFESIPCNVIECKLTSLQYKFLFHWYKDILKYRTIGDEDMKKIREYTNLGDKDIPQSTYSQIDENIKAFSGQNLFLLSCEYMTLCEDFSIFKLREDIVKDTYVKDNENLIGIHIRRSDHRLSIENSPTQLFVDKINEEIESNAGAEFYLATDDPNEEKLFMDKFGDKILIYKKKSLNRNDPQAIRDAAIDLYNLAHCRKIYGSYGSSFSDIAALWGNIPKEVLKK